MQRTAHALIEWEPTYRTRRRTHFILCFRAVTQKEVNATKFTTAAGRLVESRLLLLSNLNAFHCIICFFLCATYIGSVKRKEMMKADDDHREDKKNINLVSQNSLGLVRFFVVGTWINFKTLGHRKKTNLKWIICPSGEETQSNYRTFTHKRIGRP